MSRIEQRILAALTRLEKRLTVLDRLEKVLAESTQMDRIPPAASSRPLATTVPTAGNDEEEWLDLPEEEVVGLLSPFANEQRLKLLKALYIGVSESGRLREMTGLTGGQLYHHLKELALAKFLSRQVRGEYRLSPLGYYVFSAVMILAAELTAEGFEGEYVTPEEIGEVE